MSGGLTRRPIPLARQFTVPEDEEALQLQADQISPEQLIQAQTVAYNQDKARQVSDSFSQPMEEKMAALKGYFQRVMPQRQIPGQPEPSADVGDLVRDALVRRKAKYGK